MIVTRHKGRRSGLLLLVHLSLFYNELGMRLNLTNAAVRAGDVVHHSSEFHHRAADIVAVLLKLSQQVH